MQLNRDEIKRAYRRMKTIRVFETNIVSLFYAGEIPGFVHSYMGQEGIAVGVCHDLADDDYIGSTHRGHGHCIAKGVDVEGMMLEIFAKEGGLCGGKGGSMHIADYSKGMLGANAIVGGAPPLAVGAGITAKHRGEGKVAVAFTGDGASNQGTVFEALNLAVVLKVPTIFIFENNGHGEFTGVSYSVGGDSIAERVRGFGMPVEEVDGVDFFAVQEAMARALEYARSGKGPCAIEAFASRFDGHFVGDPQAYRTPEELAEARAKDPLPLFRKKVTEASLLDEAELDAIDAEVEAEILAAIEVARAAPAPDLSTLEKDVYVSY